MSWDPSWAERDTVDQVLAEWAVQRPDLDFSPVGIVTRLERVRAYVSAGLTEVFSRYGLSAADFQVVVNLRRAGPPYRLAQARLMKALTLTSGTVSVRIDRLARLGIVTREPDPADARGQLVQLTSRGLQLFDDIAPVHLANEDRLLSALGPAGRQQLAALLRRLLAAYEDPLIDLSQPLGLWLEPAHLARARRVAVGLSDVPGLLVADLVPAGPAAGSGISRGDLLITADGIPARSEADVRAALAAASPHTAIQLGLLRGEAGLLVSLPAASSGDLPGGKDEEG